MVVEGRVKFHRNFTAPPSKLVQITPASREANIMTAVSWNSAVSGNWSTASDWNPAQVPASADDVAIAAIGPSYTVTVDSTHAADSVTLNAPTATLDVSSALAIGGLLTLSSGALEVNSGGLVQGGTIAANGGSLVANGGTLDGVTYQGTLNLNAVNATLVLAGGITLAGTDGIGSATIDLTGDGSSLAVRNTPTLDNATISLGDNTSLKNDSFLTLGDNLSIMQTGAAANISDNGTGIINHGTVTAGFANGQFDITGFRFDNHGLVAASNADTLNISTSLLGNSTGASLSGTGIISSHINNSGVIAASGGVLQLTGTLNEVGTLAATAGSVLDLTAGGSLSHPITGAGTLELGGAYTMSGASVAIATVAVDAGASVSGNGTVQGLVADAGTLNASGGTLTLAGGIFGGGTVSAASGAVLRVTKGSNFGGTIAGAGTVAIGAVTTLATGASLSVANLIETANLTQGSSTNLANATGNRFTITAGAGRTVKLIRTGSDTFTNSGSFIANGAGTADVSPALINHGNITVGSGTLAFLYNLTNAGTIDVASGALSSALMVGGAGTIEIGATGTASLTRGAVGGQTVDFQAMTGSLDLSLPLDFKGMIAGFGGADLIDLIKTPETGYSYSGGVLNVQNGDTAVAALHFVGSYSQSNFVLGPDGHGGTAISFT
jgi:fibronectin-binding autotransporter adhesin